MISEVGRDRNVLSAPRSRPRALYPKLRPGPHSSGERESIASNQRARLYGAMIELVAARGYEASTVAELCALAGVSKRTLYERFPGGKQECFLATYDIIVHRAQTHIVAAGRHGPNVFRGARSLAHPPMGASDRLRTLVEAFAHEVAAYPNAAWLALAEAFDAGPVALARTERTRQLAERMISQSLRDSSGESAPSSLAAKRIVTEGIQVVRARLLDGHTAQLARELLDLCAGAVAPSTRESDNRLRARSLAQPQAYSLR